MTASLPSFAQIQHVKQLLGADLFGPTTIAKLTGVPLRDVFRIGSVPLHRSRLMLTSFDSPSKPTVSQRPGGNCDATATLLDGQHRLVAAGQCGISLRPIR